MGIDWALLVEAVSVLAWPVVAGVAMLLLRGPVTELALQIARRATRLAVYDVSIELATLPEHNPQWSVRPEDVHRLNSAQIFDSASQSLFDSLLKSERAEYAIVDLGRGEEWLTSRLFIFALVLGNVTKLRAFVFVETVGAVRQRFLGVATPGDIQKALIGRYPWFEQACVHAASTRYGQPLADTQGASRFMTIPSILSGEDQWAVTSFVQQFVTTLQRNSAPPPDEVESHLEIQTGLWEHAHWIDAERLERDLSNCLQRSWYSDSPDASQHAVGEAVLRREGTFVALVDQDRRFVALVDRYALLDQLSKQQSKS